MNISILQTNLKRTIILTSTTVIVYRCFILSRLQMDAQAKRFTDSKLDLTCLQNFFNYFQKYLVQDRKILYHKLIWNCE